MLGRHRFELLFVALCCVVYKREATAVLKFFTKTTEETKKEKKDAFLPAMMADGSQGLRAKNTLFVAKRRKGRFFPKQPEGLDLDGLGNQG